jgi:hypothetical protein
MSRRLVLAVTGLLALAAPAAASSYLLYGEAQMVGGYSSEAEEDIYYSMTQEEIMQKPSVGFDYLGRFSGEEGDFATAALQVRLAWNERGEERFEPQVYNAYIKLKSHFTDLWVGHNRPSLGISSYFDSHGLLLRTLAMQGFGFDRDWGAGIYRDFEWGNAAASLTTGTGAPIYLRGNYFGAGRVSYGVLSRDNHNAGISLGFGETLETMGYTLLDSEPKPLKLAAFDFTLLADNFEHRLDMIAGELWGEKAYGASWRIGLVLDGEAAWKVELQPTWLLTGGETTRQASLCVSNQTTADLTLRGMYVYDELTDDNRVLVQVYYYAQL